MYEAKKFENLIGMSGFSDVLLTNHIKLYEGYVNNTNKLMELLAEKEAGTPEYAELHRRFGWEWNGMRLHELYFGNMMPKSEALAEGNLKKKIEEVFGSFEKWEADFIGAGLMRGIGWVVLAHDKESGELFNVWINEHDAGHLTGATPLLVMDVFEHAFILDYGMNRKDYIDAFVKNINWTEVESRFKER